MRAPICSRSASCSTRWRPARCRFAVRARGRFRSHPQPRARSAAPLNPDAATGTGAHRRQVPGEGSRASLPARDARFARTCSGCSAIVDTRIRPRGEPCDARQYLLAAARCGCRGAAVVVVAVIAGALDLTAAVPTLTDKDTIVLADFTNTTGDSVFDDTLRQGLAVHSSSRRFSAFSEARILRTLALMNQSADARLASEWLRVCAPGPPAPRSWTDRLGASVVIRPLPAREDLLYRRHPRRRAGAGGTQGRCPRLPESDCEPVPKRVGESVATIEKYSRPLQEATTSSLDAWKAYTTAVKAVRIVRRGRAQPLFERAVAIDPDFAIAHAQLGFVYSGLGESDAVAAEPVKAYQLRHRASDAERFFIETVYKRQVTGNHGPGDGDAGNVGAELSAR